MTPRNPFIPGGEANAAKQSDDAVSAARGSSDRDPQALTYTTDALQKDVIVAGPIELHLAASTSAKDTDWFAMLQDIGPDGKAINLCQGIIRARFRKGFVKPVLLTPNETADYTIDLWALGNVFQKGHKIRVLASSSCFPLYDRNLNTGDNNGTTTKMAVASQTILHNNAHPSYLVLPTLDR